jgi:hypothetical protein
MAIPWLVFIVAGLSAYSCFVKLAGRLLGYRVSWKSSFLFALLMLISVILAHMLDVHRPATTRIGHGGMLLLAFIVLGGWFFSSRGTDRDGGVLGWGRGMRLIGLAFAMMVIAVFTVAISVQAFTTSHLLSSP